ncbi:hypothetical protein ACFQX6_58785 [Streptosporangium lutulentum]
MDEAGVAWGSGVRSFCEDEGGGEDRGEEAAVGVPRSGGPVGAPRGSGALLIPVNAAPSGSIFTSSKTWLRSTSRTPNQATQIARAVAPHHTAMNPSV